MSDLNTKLNSTLSSVNSIETALESKTGQNLDSTPLSGFDDVINQLELLESAVKTFIDNFGYGSGTYAQKANSIYSHLKTLVSNYSSSLDMTVTFRNNNICQTISDMTSALGTQVVNIGRAIEDIGIDLNSDYSISNMINALNEYAASSGSNSVYCTYINTTGSRTMYGCMPSGSMQSVSAATGSSTLGHQIDTFRGLAIGCNGSWSYDYEPCTALWNATDQDNYGSYKGFYLYRMPSSSVTVHTDFDGTGTRSLYGMLCCYTSSCVVGDSFNG